MNILHFLQGRSIKHPLHPLLVHIPVGLWAGSLICDIIYFVTGEPRVASASYYCMLIGIIGAVVAAVPGLAEFVAIPVATQPRRMAATHLILNIIVTGLYLINVLFRHSLEGTVPSLITGGQFILSIFAILLLGVSGYIGGLLVYNYGIGFKPQLRGREPVRPERTERAA